MGRNAKKKHSMLFFKHIPVQIHFIYCSAFESDDFTVNRCVLVKTTTTNWKTLIDGMMLDDFNVKLQIIYIHMALAIEDTTTSNMKRMIERWNNIQTKGKKWLKTSYSMRPNAIVALCYISLWILKESIHNYDLQSYNFNALLLCFVLFKFYKI